MTIGIETAFDNLIGNADTKKYFVSALSGSSLSHAYIVEGTRGSGRHTLVRAITLALAYSFPSSRSGSDAARRIISENSPDILGFAAASGRKTIGVDTVRDIRKCVYVRPSELDFKVITVTGADTMTVAAQNAALKILEEPPAGVYFFLICENSSLLLPTVRSRAQTIRMQKLSEDELDSFLSRIPKYSRLRDGNERERYEKALAGADGSIGEAMRRIDASKEYDSQSAAAMALAGALASNVSRDILLAAMSLPSDRDEFGKILTALCTALRDLIYVKEGGRDALLFFSDYAGASDICRKLTRKTLRDSYDSVARLRAELVNNVNMQNARIALADRLIASAGL